MPENDSNHFDATQRQSSRGDEKKNEVVREHETDRENGNAPYGNVVSPKGDDAAENRVTTSLSED